MDEGTFPNEVWLEIFKKINTLKLMELRLVCHRFYDLIEYLLHKDPQWEWKKLALKVMMYENLEMTMQRAYPYDLVSRWPDIYDPVLWRGTYLSYKKWQKILVNTHTKDTIVPATNSGDISCIRTFDKYIAIGFHNGSIASYTIDNISQPFYVAKHGTSIIQIEFWYSNGDVLVVSVGDDYTLKFWDLQNKTEIATNGLFANSISSGECRHFCIGVMSGILTSYERVGNRISPGPTHNLELRHDQQVIAHAHEGIDMMSISWDNENSGELRYHGVIEDGKLIKFKWTFIEHWDELSEELGASLRFITFSQIHMFFFVIGTNRIGSIYLLSHNYDDKWKERNLSRHFGCNVNSVAMHAQILMFGLEDGSIHLLHIPYYSHVKTRLEEMIKHSKKIKVDTEPIIELTVLEVDKKPCIVAATDQKVHLINFF